MDKEEIKTKLCLQDTGKTDLASDIEQKLENILEQKRLLKKKKSQRLKFKFKNYSKKSKADNFFKNYR